MIKDGNPIRVSSPFPTSMKALAFSVAVLVSVTCVFLWVVLFTSPSALHAMPSFLTTVASSSSSLAPQLHRPLPHLDKAEADHHRQQQLRYVQELIALQKEVNSQRSDLINERQLLDIRLAKLTEMLEAVQQQYDQQRQQQATPSASTATTTTATSDVLTSLDVRVGQLLEGHHKQPLNDRYVYLGNFTAMCHVSSLGVPRRLLLTTRNDELVSHVCSGRPWRAQSESFFYRVAKEMPHSRGSTIVELGTGVGYMTQLFGFFAKRRQGRVVGMELNAELLQLCKRGVAISDLTSVTTLTHGLPRSTNTSSAADGGVAAPPSTDMDTAALQLDALFPVGVPLSKYWLVKLDLTADSKVKDMYETSLWWHALRTMMRRRKESLPHVTVTLPSGEDSGSALVAELVASMRATYGFVGRVEGDRCVDSATDDDWTAAHSSNPPVTVCLRAATSNLFELNATVS